MKTAIKLHYGKCKIKWTTPVTKSLDILAFVVLIMTTFQNKMLVSPPSSLQYQRRLNKDQIQGHLRFWMCSGQLTFSQVIKKWKRWRRSEHTIHLVLKHWDLIHLKEHIVKHQLQCCMVFCIYGDVQYIFFLFSCFVEDGIFYFVQAIAYTLQTLFLPKGHMTN